MTLILETRENGDGPVPDDRDNHALARHGGSAILGCVPLWTASGSGAVARQVMGTTVIGGMLAATFIAIFLIPVTYHLVERFAASRRQHAELPAPVGESSSTITQ